MLHAAQAGQVVPVRAQMATTLGFHLILATGRKRSCTSRPLPLVHIEE
jgi:hypothetical protein